MSTSQAQMSVREKLLSLPIPLVIGCSFLPLLLWHIGGLLEKPHYQFLFLLPLTIWILWPSATSTHTATVVKKWEAALSISTLAMVLPTLAFASWTWSPWLAAVSFQLAVAAAFVGSIGRRASKRWFPLWLFSWIIVPLPFGMDEDLIIQLRGYTTRISSSVLDQIGVFHNSYANVIELPGKPLFIADACSGIHSLYVLMAAALFICAWLKRRFAHSVVLLASTFVLVLVENATRIVSVAVAWERGWDWSIGFNHEVLGIVLFCTSLTLICTTDSLLLFFFPPNAPSLRERLRVFRSGKTSTNYYETAAPRAKAVPASDLMSKTLRTLALACPLLLIVQAFSMPSTMPHALAIADKDYELPSLGKDALPETINGFSMTEYDTIARVPGDPFGQGSQQWTFEKDGLTCLISVDYPYPNPHDLTVCYTNIGWHRNNREKLEISGPPDANAGSAGVAPVGMAEFSRPLFGNAVLLFNHTNLDGATQILFKDEVVGTPDERAQRRWTALTERKNESAQSSRSIESRTFLQFQLFVRSAKEFNDDQKAELLAVFQEATNQLKRKLLSR